MAMASARWVRATSKREVSVATAPSTSLYVAPASSSSISSAFCMASRAQFSAEASWLRIRAIEARLPRTMVSR